MMKPYDKGFYSKLYLALFLMVAVQVLGIAGFMTIEDYTLVSPFI